MGVDDPAEKGETEPQSIENGPDHWEETDGKRSNDPEPDIARQQERVGQHDRSGSPSEFKDDRSKQQAATGPDEQYCSTCGAVIKKEAEICPECGVRQDEPTLDASASEKDRVTAGVLAILLGGVGAHKFYLGKHGQGILYLLFVWTLIPPLVALVEGILYLMKSDAEFQRQYAP